MARKPETATEAEVVDPLQDLWAIVDVNPHYPTGLAYLSDVKPEWRQDILGDDGRWTEGAFLIPATAAHLELARGKASDFRVSSDA
jgi:hypothetical protein